MNDTDIRNERAAPEPRPEPEQAPTHEKLAQERVQHIATRLIQPIRETVFDYFSPVAGIPIFDKERLREVERLRDQICEEADLTRNGSVLFNGMACGRKAFATRRWTNICLP